MTGPGLTTSLGSASVTCGADRYHPADAADATRDALLMGHAAPAFFIRRLSAENREDRPPNLLALEAEL